MYHPQTKIFAQAGYGEGDYSVNTYPGTTQTVTPPATGGEDSLPNTGQDILLVIGIGLVVLAVSLFVVLKRHARPPKTDIEA